MGFDNVNVNVSGSVQPASTYKTKVLKGNHSFASQVTEPNTKYVIKHNFDLGGESVTIPENCILEFDGGSLRNGLCKSNHTIIKGEITDISKTSLYGVFYNEYGNILYNFKPIINTTVNLDWAEIKSVDKDLTPFPQSIIKHNNYILIFGNIGSSGLNVRGINLYDQNYNLLGRKILTSTQNHFNGVTEYDGKLYSAGWDTGAIHICNIQDCIDACLSGTDISFTDVVISNNKVSSITYDKNADKFLVLNDYYLEQYSTSLVFEKRITQQKIYNIIEDADYDKHNCQSGFVLNGLYFQAITLGTSGLFDNALVIVDCASGEVLGFQKLILDNPGYEIESPYLCDDGTVLVLANGNVCNNNTTFVFSLDFNNPNYSINVNERVSAGLNHNNVYVDNSYTGRSDGTNSAPYKTIQEAIASTIGRENIYFRIAGTSTAYKIGELLFDNGNQYNFYWDGVNKPTIKGTFVVQHSTSINLRSLIIDADTYPACVQVNDVNVCRLYYCDLITQHVSTLVVGGYTGCVKGGNSNVWVSNCTFDGYRGFMTDLTGNINITFLNDVTLNTRFFTCASKNNNIFLPPIEYTVDNGFDGISFGSYFERFITVLTGNGVPATPSMVVAITSDSYNTITHLLANHSAKFTIDNGLIILKNMANSHIKVNGQDTNIWFVKGEYTLTSTRVNVISTSPVGTTAYFSVTKDNIEKLLNVGSLLEINSRFIFGGTHPVNGETSFQIASNALIDTSVLAPNHGATADRPLGSGATNGVLNATMNIGFRYFDTTLGKPIYASAIASDGTVTWVDATGATV